MNSTLLAYDFRRLLPWWTLSLTALAGLYLLLPGPLRPFHVFSFSSVCSRLIAGVVFGGLVTTRLFIDSGGTQAFVYSRGLTRRSIFVNRVLLAGLIVAVTSILLWILLWLPLRGALHRTMGYEDAIYYPTIGRFEPTIALHFGVIAMIVVSLLAWYQTVRAIVKPRTAGSGSGFVRLWLLELPVFAVALMFFLWAPSNLVPMRFVAVLIAILSSMAMLVAWKACRCLEVED